ncbi:hypothetical protein HPB52_020157 [Rhipicephalus sanguineus]|uniref:Uncharacterized protein n=1 Tax=Rhipicephalus sanguineus TaxID=34632 RepID=A0A9D4PS78_RHISA|nr:hypothetical protein HPB52_020157 [Rhipicephalus sanguineus]
MEAPAPATPMYCTDQNPLTPSPFRGDLFQDVDDWRSLDVSQASPGHEVQVF